MDISSIEKIAARLSYIVKTRHAQYLAERAHLATFDGNTCTGQVSWRDQDKPGLTPRMIVLHSVNQTCPIHGEPKKGGRLRTYIGTNLGKQQTAIEAIEREGERKECEKQVRAMERAFSRGLARACEAIETLGYIEKEGELKPANRWPVVLRW